MAISFVGASIKAEQSGVAGTTQTGTTVAGVAAGDLILIETSASVAGSAWAQASITNWTIDQDIVETSMITRVIWRIANGTSADLPPAVTTSAAAHRVTQVAVYRGVDTTTPFIAKNGQPAAATQTSHATPSLVNTDANAWAVYLGAARQVATPLTWTATASNKVTTERVDLDTALATTNNASGTVYDSNGVVATGTYTLAATTSATTAQSCVWGAFLKPAAATSATTASPGVASATSTAAAPALTSTVSVAPGAASSTASASAPALTSTVTVSPSSVAGSGGFGNDFGVSFGGATSSGFGTGAFGSMPFGGGGSPAVAYAPTVTISAPTAGVTATPGIAGAAATALAPTVTATVTATPGVATSTASALAPTVASTVTVAPAVATTAATALPPVVTASGGPTTAIPGAASSTAAALAPVVTSTVTVTPGVASSTVAVYAPTITATATVTPGVAVSSSAVYPPVVTALALDNYFPHVPVTAVIAATVGTATLAGDGTSAAILAAATPGTATITPATAMTAVLAGNGQSTATLAGDGTSTATLIPDNETAELQLV